MFMWFDTYISASRTYGATSCHHAPWLRGGGAGALVRANPDTIALARLHLRSAGPSSRDCARYLLKINVISIM